MNNNTTNGNSAKNNFEFISDDDLYLKNNGKMELRFLGDANSPYFYIPFQLWFFEKQMTGNDCFRYYKGTHSQDINNKYRDKFWMVTKMYIPECKKLPTGDDEFNEIIKHTGLINVSAMDLTYKIILEQNDAVIKRPKHGATTHNKEFEILRYKAEDITALNMAYRECMQNTPSPVIKSIYEEIAYQYI